MEFLQSNPTGLQSWILWGHLLLLPDLQAGEPLWGSEHSLLGENVCGIIIFQFVGLHPVHVGFDSILIVASLGVGHLFCGFQHVFCC